KNQNIIPGKIKPEKFTIDRHSQIKEGNSIKIPLLSLIIINNAKV
ncbi:18532_t:CDS:1, partial [Racocetra fulgida]